MSRRIDRRKFLAGSGVMLSLPMLDYFSSFASAAPEAPPKRLIVFYCTQGMDLNLWTPTQVGSDYQLNDAFQEPIGVGGGQSVRLNDFKDDLTIINGIDCASAEAQGGNSHTRAAGHGLTGVGMTGNDQTNSGGPSFDYLISEAITPASVPYKSLHLGLKDKWEVCFTGPGQPVSRMTDPNDVVEALFGNFENNANAEAQARRRAQQQSILDATKGNIDLLRPRLSAADRVRLDEYLARVADIEHRINANFAVGEQCSPLSPYNLQKSPLRDYGSNNFNPYYDVDVVTKPIVDCMVEALACDRTRVATLAIGDANRYHWLGSPNPNDPYLQAPNSGDWHADVVHEYFTGSHDPLMGEQIRRVVRWEHSLFAYLLHKLKSRQEGAGTLLDNCVVLYVNEFGDGTHEHLNKPYMIAGKGGGAIKDAQWLQYSGQPHNRLLLSLMRVFGMQDATFGDEDFCSGGPLTEFLT
jgi:hypothetical protein